MTENTVQGRIGRGMLVSSLGIFLSRLLGLAREIVFARFWGTGEAFGAFVVAFTIPNLFRQLMGEGALSQAFVPLFNEKLAQQGKTKAFLFLSNVLTVVATILAAIVAIGIGVTLLLRPWLPGPLAQLTLALLPWLLPYTFFICLTGFLAGVLHSFEHFAAPSLASSILNVLFIGATLFLCPRLGPDESSRIFGLAWAVLAAGVLQLALLAPVLLKQGFVYRFLPSARTPAVKELGLLVLPGFAGAAAYQLSVLCDRLLAGWLGAYAVTSLYYSERLIQLPIGIFAVAMATACLPSMSRAAARRDEGEMVAALTFSLRLILFLTLPCIVLLMVLALPLVALVYQRGNFTADSLGATVPALLYYAPSIAAFAAIKILRNGFYSRKDMRSPVRIGISCLLANIVLSLLLMGPLKQCGLALATTLTAYLHVFLLARLLSRELTPTGGWLRQLGPTAARLAPALAAMAVGMVVCRPLVAGLGVEGLWGKGLAVLAPAAAGSVTYLFTTMLLGAREPRELLNVFRRLLVR